MAKLAGHAPLASVAVVSGRLQGSRKYREIHPDTIDDIVRREAAVSRDDHDLERRARLRLHRAVAGYLSSVSQRDLLMQLDNGAIATGSSDEARAWCRNAMRGHVSSQERLADLETMYPALSELIGPVLAVADLACALNVLSLPWFQDNFPGEYVGYDFNNSFVALGRALVKQIDARARLVHADVVVTPAVVEEQVAFLFKTFHCLESRAAGSGLQLIENLRANIVVVSLPTRTRSGRPMGFGARYGEEIRAHSDDRGWTVRTVALPTEEFWAITKRT